MLDNLNKELGKVAIKWELELKDLIRKGGHVASGNLLKSIKVKLSYGNGNIDIDITGKEYLTYLEDGKLLDNFLKDKLKDLNKLIIDSISKDIIKEIKL